MMAKRVVKWVKEDELKLKRWTRVMIGAVAGGFTAAGVAFSGTKQGICLGLGAFLSAVALGINLGDPNPKAAAVGKSAEG